MRGDLPAPSFTPGTGGKTLPTTLSDQSHQSGPKDPTDSIGPRNICLCGGMLFCGGGGLDLTALARRNRDRHTGTETASQPASQPASETATDGGNM